MTVKSCEVPLAHVGSGANPSFLEWVNGRLSPSHSKSMGFCGQCNGPVLWLLKSPPRVQRRYEAGNHLTGCPRVAQNHPFWGRPSLPTPLLCHLYRPRRLMPLVPRFVSSCTARGGVPPGSTRRLASTSAQRGYVKPLLGPNFSIDLHRKTYYYQ